MIHPAQEADVVPGRKLLVTGAGIVVAIIVCVLIAWGLGRCTATDWSETRRTPAAPIPLEVNAVETVVFMAEAQGLEGNLRAEEYLRSYGWVDPSAQIIHVPIEVAFELYLSRQAKPAPPAALPAQRPEMQSGGPR